MTREEFISWLKEKHINFHTPYNEDSDSISIISTDHSTHKVSMLRINHFNYVEKYGTVCVCETKNWHSKNSNSITYHMKPEELKEKLFCEIIMCVEYSPDKINSQKFSTL